MANRHKKIVAAEAKLIQKQQNEMLALRKKIEANMNEKLKQRENEHNKYDTLIILRIIIKFV